MCGLLHVEVLPGFADACEIPEESIWEVEDMWPRRDFLTVFLLFAAFGCVTVWNVGSNILQEPVTRCDILEG